MRTKYGARGAILLEALQALKGGANLLGVLAGACARRRALERCHPLGDRARSATLLVTGAGKVRAFNPRPARRARS